MITLQGSVHGQHPLQREWAGVLGQGLPGSCQPRSFWAAGTAEAAGQGYVCHLYFPVGKFISYVPNANLNKDY